LNLLLYIFDILIYELLIKRWEEVKKQKIQKYFTEPSTIF
jgi:hypothetical protein